LPERHPANMIIAASSAAKRPAFFMGLSSVCFSLFRPVWPKLPAPHCVNQDALSFGRHGSVSPSVFYCTIREPVGRNPAVSFLRPGGSACGRGLNGPFFSR
jgi:hypothetical protein